MGVCANAIPASDVRDL